MKKLDLSLDLNSSKPVNPLALLSLIGGDQPAFPNIGAMSGSVPAGTVNNQAVKDSVLVTNDYTDPKAFVKEGSIVNGPSNASDAAANWNGAVDATPAQQFAPLSEAMLRSVGYTGPIADVPEGSGENFSGMVRNPQLQKFLDDSGYSFGVQKPQRGEGDRINTTAVFDKNGKQIGTPYQWDSSAFDSPEFGVVLGVLASLAGGAAAAGLAAGAGSGITAAASGAGAGFGGTLSQTADIGDALKGAAVGGLTGGLTSTINPAALAGVTDSTWANVLNRLASSTAVAGVQGKDPIDAGKNSLFGSLLGSLVKKAGPG